MLSERHKKYAILLSGQTLVYFRMSLGRKFLYVPEMNQESSIYFTHIAIPVRPTFPYTKPFNKMFEKLFLKLKLINF